MTFAECALLGVAGLEIVLRLCLEIREARLSHGKVGRFAFLRMVPIVNDLFPAEANFEKAESSGAFERAHENAHRKRRHGILRLAFQAGFALFCALAIGAAGVELRFGLWELLLLFHLLFAVSKIFFHAMCFAEEYEADALAAKSVQFGVAKRALESLMARECPRSALFALVYRTHPTAKMRLERILASGKRKRG